MAVTKTRTVGYGSRVKDSCMGVFVGIGLFLVGTYVIGCNEFNAKKTSDMLEEVAEKVEHIDVTKRSSDNVGLLAHASADAVTTDSLVDPDFGVGFVGIKLERTVEYYQWQENTHEERRDKLGGGEEIITTYTYEKKWVSQPINSSGFEEAGHTNTVNYTTDNKTEWAKNVAFGDYKLPEFLIQSISGNEDMRLNIPEANMKELNRTVANAKGVSVTTPVTVNTSDSTVQNDNYAYAHVNKNELYLGRNASSPEIGDVKITFSCIPCKTISVIATVTEDSFKKYKASNKKTFSKVMSGKVDQEEMLDAAESESTMWKWLMRVGGTLAVCVGIMMMFNLLVTIAKVVPFISKIIEFGTTLISFIIGIIWSLLVMVICWIAARPWIIVVVIGVIAAVGFFLYKNAQTKKLKEELAAAKNSTEENKE